MKYVIYLRVSTDQQVKQGFSLEAQREVCLGYIKEKGSQVLEYADEGFSGALKIERRPALLEAVNILEKDDVLLIAKRDRIGRDPIVNAMIERAVERKKARLISASGDVSDDNDPSSVLMRRMVDAFSEYERLIIGSRTRAALQVKKQKGQRTGHIPYGYRVCVDNVHLEPDEKEQRNLDFINSLKNDEYSFREIAKELNKKKIYNRDGKPWSHVSVFRVRNNIYQDILPQKTLPSPK